MPPSQPRPSQPAVPELHVHTPDGRVLRFSQPFRIGRDHDCELRLNDVHVSRKHASASFENGAWCLRDLKSANGMYVDGQRVETVSVIDTVDVVLGTDGPTLGFEVAVPGKGTGSRRPAAETVQQAGGETRLLASYEQRYFGGGPADERVGGRTMMIRRAFERVQRKQRRKYWWIVGVVAVAGASAAGFALYKHRQVAAQQELAQEIFYQMKALDVGIANMERAIAQSGNTEAREQAKTYMSRRRDLESTYDRFVAMLNLYDSRLTEEERLILRVTRMFGECELAAPPEYIRHIKNYIERWRSSKRFANAVKLAQDMGYTRIIAEEFLAQNLPPQFFYLAMQESDFNAFISGPPTYAGIAKGMWQFIPETGARYGLTIGPLAHLPRPDPQDDRHDWRKATKAAAQYIKEIYSTDAQASGLLVMASYNWGENRVVKLIRGMPENPQERNFWQLLEKHRHRVPQQTYDYVFYIVSAAVIGENPRLFGFPFDSPLGFLEKQ